MGTAIPAEIFRVRGQVVNSVAMEGPGVVCVSCRRDARFAAVDAVTGQRGRTNRRLRRRIWDVPMFGHRVALDIEYLEIVVGARDRRVEQLEFVEAGARYTKRLAELVSALCRHLPISAVSRWTGLAWRTVKDMDRSHLRATLPALNPRDITGVRILGIDEVARAKGHDYVTVVYDLESGALLWVGDGRSAENLSVFLAALTQETAEGIQAVAIDMSAAFAKAVREQLPQAAIVHDRFHVMQLYGKAVDQIRRREFKSASPENQDIIKGTRYLLLRHRDDLSSAQQVHLDRLLDINHGLHTAYVLKEQLQALWESPKDVTDMCRRLVTWCDLAHASGLPSLRRFARTLKQHSVGICNYARFPITTARVEAGNVAIGMIRKRARGMLDTDYFKLKIRQSATRETPLALFPMAR
jgi:transposase